MQFLFAFLDFISLLLLCRCVHGGQSTAVYRVYPLHLYGCQGWNSGHQAFAANFWVPPPFSYLSNLCICFWDWVSCSLIWFGTGCVAEDGLEFPPLTSSECCLPSFPPPKQVRALSGCACLEHFDSVLIQLLSQCSVSSQSLSFLISAFKVCFAFLDHILVCSLAGLELLWRPNYL